MMQLNKKASHLLLHNKKTVSCAESCTGGLLSHSLTNVPGSSKFFWGSIIAYDNSVKSQLLGVSIRTLKNHGAVSQIVAQNMAQNVRKKLKTDFGIGITGIAGPDGGSRQKPVGLVFICVSSAHKILAKKFIFPGSRLTIKKQAVKMALRILCSLLD